jgi:glycosyltransferase involved in cell wall biosynthesis
VSGLRGLTAAICTRNRPDLLARALESLVTQTPAVAEILVVDNAPADDATRSLVATRFPSVRYLAEPVPGLDFARNRALEAATREVVAFLDDDAVAAPGWAGSLHGVFEADAGVAICTGRVEPLSLETPGQRLFEANGGFSRGADRIRLPDDAGRLLHGRRAPLIAWAISVGSGCSYAVRRGTARALGGFDEALAWHEHRRDVEAVHDQIAGHQRAVLAFLAKHLMGSDSRSRPALLGYTGWRLAKPGFRLLRRAVGRDPLPARLLVRMWWNCWLGLLVYPRARRLARRRREVAR